jgi:hypothetical protein
VNGPVLAYCSPRSVAPGETVAIHAGGAGGRFAFDVVCDSAPDGPLVWRGEIDVPSAALTDTMVEDGCGWPAASTLRVDGSWPSGLYLVRFRREGEGGADPATAWFVVRAPQPRARALLVLSTNTWNAYNDTGSRNLYTGATAVSFERPLAPGMLEKPEGLGRHVADGAREYLEFTTRHGLGLWNGMAGWANEERRFAHWAVAAGFDLDFAINEDVERVPGLLRGYRCHLSVGHDEYWSSAMRDAVEAFVADGGNVAFLSGNTCYWQVRVEGHRMVGYKHRYTEDPCFGTDRQALTTTMWSDPIVGRPENALTGVSFTRGGYHRIHHSVPHGAGAYEVHRPDHWMLAGTGLERGDLLGSGAGVVGYECDGCELTLVDGLPVPTGSDGTPPGFEVVGTAPATPFDEHNTPLPLAPGGDYELAFHARRLLGDDSPASRERLRNGHAVLGCHERGGTVVTTGCTDWAHGLGDPMVDRVTRNILERLTR